MFTRRVTVACLLAILLAGTSAVAGARSNKDKKKKKPAVPAAPQPAPVPFHYGETLDYRVAWATFSTAATIRIATIEQRDLYGWSSWHFRAVANTVKPVRTLFAIDDEFDSYTDAANFSGHQYEMYLDELGRKETNLMEFTPQGSVPRGNVASVIVPPDTRDPIGLLYSLRAADWDHARELRAEVFDGRNLYEVHATRESAEESVTVAAGKYSTSRIAIQVFAHGKEVAGTQFQVWLAHDAAHTPVSMRAEIPFGTFHVELTSAADHAQK